MDAWWGQPDAANLFQYNFISNVYSGTPKGVPK